MGVPHWYIKRDNVNWDEEIFDCLGVPIVVGSEEEQIEIYSPPIGVWSLLESLNCDFHHPAKHPTDWGCMVALYVCAVGRDSSLNASTWVRDGSRDKLEAIGYDEYFLSDSYVQKVTMGTAHPFELDVRAFCEKVKPREEDFVNLHHMLCNSFAGFAMIPGNDCKNFGYLYGADTIGYIVSTIGSEASMSYEQVIWDIPLILAGFMIVSKAKMNGASNIERPVNHEDAKQKTIECRDRDRQGLLHPWQEKYPLDIECGLDGHENKDEEYRFAVIFNKAQARVAEGKLHPHQEKDPLRNKLEGHENKEEKTRYKLLYEEALNMRNFPKSEVK